MVNVAAPSRTEEVRIANQIPKSRWWRFADKKWRYLFRFLLMEYYVSFMLIEKENVQSVSSIYPASTAVLSYWQPTSAGTSRDTRPWEQ